MNMKNKYIAIEGLEGAGKTTVLNAILKLLKENNIDENDIELTREPGGTPIAEKCRAIVKGQSLSSNVYENPDDEMTDLAEIMLFFAARYQLIENVVVPALQSGKCVLSDRSHVTTEAYQQNHVDVVQYLTSKLVVVPDVIVLIDIDPVIGLERARGRGELDRIEQKNIDFFYQARQRYLDYAKEHDNVIIVNGNQTKENVEKDVIEALKDYFK